MSVRGICICQGYQTVSVREMCLCRGYQAVSVRVMYLYRGYQTVSVRGICLCRGYQTVSVRVMCLCQGGLSGCVRQRYMYLSGLSGCVRQRYMSVSGLSDCVRQRYMSVSGLSDCVSKRYVHVSVKGVILCQSVSVMEYVSVSIRGINTCQSKSCVCVSQGYKLCQFVSVSVSNKSSGGSCCSGSSRILFAVGWMLSQKSINQHLEVLTVRPIAYQPVFNLCVPDRKSIAPGSGNRLLSSAQWVTNVPAAFVTLTHR